MKVLLSLMQQSLLTSASPLMGMRESTALEQAIDQTMMNMDAIMAKFANYEELENLDQMEIESINQLAEQKRLNWIPKNYNHRKRGGKRCWWKLCAKH